MRNLTKVAALAAVPVVAATIALPVLSASASTRAPVLPTPTHVSAFATDLGNGSDNVTVSWNYRNYRGVRFEVVEHLGDWSANAATVTNSHQVTFQIAQGSRAHGYTFSVYAFRKGSYKSVMSWSSGTVSIPALPPVTIAIVNPVWATTPSCVSTLPDTLSYTVAVTGYSSVTEIDTYITGVKDTTNVLATDTLSAGSFTGDVGSPAMSLTQPAPPTTNPPAIAVTVELMNGTQLLATSAPFYTTAPHCT
jgi:hypothetical protein